MKNHIRVEQLQSRRKNAQSWHRFLFSPLSRIIIAIAFIIPVIMVNNLTSEVISTINHGSILSVIQMIKTTIVIALLIISYRFYLQNIELRKNHELSSQKAAPEIMIGFGIGASMVLFITCILAVLGCYKIDQFNSPILLITRLFRYSQGAFLEELIFTIIIFRLLEEFSNTAVAYIIVCLFFGGMHLMNDNATISTSLYISIQQITLLAPFILTRRIWMGWAVHTSWNFVQAGVFGMNNSGMNHGGFITPHIDGPTWLTGGDFGIEASIIGLIVNVIVGAAMLITAGKREQILPVQIFRKKN